MHRLLCLLAFTTACNQSFDGPLSEHAEGKADGFGISAFPSAAGGARFADLDDTQWLVASLCPVGNGGHTIGTFDPELFDASEALESLVELDDTAHGCTSRTYSSSKQDGIDTFVEFLDNGSYKDQVLDCVDGFAGLAAIPSPDFFESKWQALVSDPENRAVFSSKADPLGDDDPFSCNYQRFLIYRADGTVLRLYYDYSD